MATSRASSTVRISAHSGEERGGGLEGGERFLQDGAAWERAKAVED